MTDHTCQSGGLCLSRRFLVASSKLKCGPDFILVSVAQATRVQVPARGPVHLSLLPVVSSLIYTVQFNKALKKTKNKIGLAIKVRSHLLLL